MKQHRLIKPVKNYTAIDKFILKADKELSGFFKVSIEKPNINFISSRKEINRIWGMKTEKWFKAWLKNGNIYILDPEICAKESNYRTKHFWQILKHEYSHLYYKKLTGINYPKWLNEGLACYFARQIRKKPSQEDSIKVFDYFRKSDWQIYDVGYFWVKLLIDVYGKNKIFKLLCLLNQNLNERKFGLIFNRVYEAKFTKNDLHCLYHLNNSKRH